MNLIITNKLVTKDNYIGYDSPRVYYYGLDVTESGVFMLEYSESIVEIIEDVYILSFDQIWLNDVKHIKRCLTIYERLANLGDYMYFNMNKNQRVMYYISVAGLNLFKQLVPEWEGWSQTHILNIII